MWIFLSDSFLSIIAHHHKPDVLIVRGRAQGDVERVFPDARVTHTPERDYPYRAEIAREQVASAIARKIQDIQYTNFKDSVSEHDRHDVYFQVWESMVGFQQTRRTRRIRRP